MTETATAPVELEVGYAGKSIPRKEDGRLVQGQGVFADDIKRHGMGYVHFVRAPYAHARIVSVDVSAAEALDGVYGTLTPDEVAELSDPFFELTTAPGNQIKDYALAVGRVRHIGEPVVAVVAETRELPGTLPTWSRSSTSLSTSSSTRAARRTRALRSSTTTPARTSSGQVCSTGATSTER